MTPREEKLAKLLAMANDKANEHEANSAMEMAQEYAERWGLSLDDIERKSDATDKIHWGQTEWQFSCYKRGFGMVDKYCTRDIAVLFGCTVWRDLDKDGDSGIFFYGHEADREAAMALRRVISKAMYNDWQVRKAGERWKGAELTEHMLSFHAGMGDRLNGLVARRHRAQERRNRQNPLGTD